MRILIIDDDRRFSSMVKRLIADIYPHASSTVYDTSKLGRPTASFPWGQHDVLFLDFHLGQYSGLDWLKEFGSDMNFPATIFLAEQIDEITSDRAIKSGAKIFIPKTELTPKLVRTSIYQAFRDKRHAVKSTPRKSSDKTSNQVAPLFTEKEIAEDKNRIGNYRLLSLLGEGGMSNVYLAETETDGQNIAIKLLDSSLIECEEQLDRFIQEYQLGVDVCHPNLIQVYEQGFADGITYIAMEFLPGGDLRKPIKEQSLSQRQAISHIDKIADALGALHDNGIIHRDIKPANVLFNAEGQPVLSDFGTAKPLDDSPSLTFQGEVVGTPLYISPEQINKLELDERCDLYSLGIMFYEMIAGRLPFQTNALPTMLYKHVYEVPDDIKDIPEDLNAIIMKLLAKQPDDRYQTTLELQMDLSELAHETESFIAKKTLTIN